MPITIRKHHLTLDHKTWVFPAGECGVRLDTANRLYHDATTDDHGRPITHQTIWARLQSAADIMELVLLVDALRRWDSTPIRLVMPTTPYQRQDRVCVSGESFSIKAFASIINGLAFDKIITFDAHSEVTPAVFDRMEIIDQATVIGRFDKLNAHLQPSSPADRPIFISPDAGANKKTASLAGLYGHSAFIRADKLRDLATGKIKEIVVVNPREDVEGRDCMICDDIGDRCGTFVGLAAALKTKGAKRIDLFVTHGLFTAEIDSILNPLLEAGVSHIWTTNAYRTDTFAKPEAVTVLKLEDVFSL